MGTTGAISLGEYLATSYRPDCEYIDGELKEKPVVEYIHGRVQILLGIWFGQFEEEWAIETAAETRTRVAATKVRLPDLVIVTAKNRERGTLTQPPLVAIEVLSPTDSYADLRARAADLSTMGVQNIWLLDPATRSAESWRDGFWQPVVTDRLEALDLPVFLDLRWLWSRLPGA